MVDAWAIHAFLVCASSLSLVLSRPYPLSFPLAFYSIFRASPLTSLSSPFSFVHIAPQSHKAQPSLLARRTSTFNLPVRHTSETGDCLAQEGCERHTVGRNVKARATLESSCPAPCARQRRNGSISSDDHTQTTHFMHSKRDREGKAKARVHAAQNMRVSVHVTVFVCGSSDAVAMPPSLCFDVWAVPAFCLSFCPPFVACL